MIFNGIVKHVIAENGACCFIGGRAFEGQRSLESYRKFIGLKIDQSRLTALDLSDYQARSEILLEDLHNLFLSHRRPWVIAADFSAELNADHRQWWKHCQYIRDQFMSARVLTCISGEPPPYVRFDRRIHVAANGFELTVTETPGDEVTHWKVQPRRGVAVLTEQEAAHG